MVGRSRPATARVERGDFGRWLAYAAALHASVLLGAALASSRAPLESSSPATSTLAETELSLDVVEDRAPAQAASTTREPSASPSPLGGEATPPSAAPPAASPGRDLKAPSPGASIHRAADAAPGAPRGLGTISDGTGAWPTNIPHHLGKITGSRHGGVAVWGQMPEASIRRRVGEHSPSILRCYSEGLSTIPNLAGRAIMRFIIERDGRVERVNTLGSNFPSKSVLRCLERLFRQIRFPEPSAGTVTVTYPLPLSSTQAPNWETIP